MTEILILCLVCLVVYFKTLRFKYVSDDIPVWAKTKDMKKGLKRLWCQLEGSVRVNTEQDRLITILIHTLTTVFLYIGFGSNHVSFIAALLFSVNPTTNQASVWISGRSYALPALFIVASLSMPYISPLFLYACTYYNAGFFSPIAFLFSPYKWIMLFVPLIWVLRMKFFISKVKDKASKEMFAEDKKVHPKKLILFFKTFGYYMTLCVIPFRNTFYHAYLQSAAGNQIMKKRAYSIDKFFFIGLSVFSFFIYYMFTHNNLLSFAMGLVIFSVCPFCNMFRLSQEIAERYVYASLIGTSFILAWFLSDYSVIIAFIFGVYLCRMWFVMDMYKDDYFLQEFSCLNSSDAWFSWHIRALKRWENQSFKEALTLWVMANLISPLEFKILMNIATILKVTKQDKEAEVYLNKAMSNIPEGQEEQAHSLLNDWKSGKLPILV